MFRREVSLPPPRQHRVRIILVVALTLVVALMVAGALLRSRSTPNSSSLAAADAPLPAFCKSMTPGPGVTAVFIGDSYTSAGRWPCMVAREQHWAQMNLGRGGTGYLKSSSGAEAQRGCARTTCPNFLQMVPVAVSKSPDIVVVSGGRNDLGADPSENIKATFQLLRAGLPRARIIALQPMWDSKAYPEPLERFSDTIEGSVTSVGGEYLTLGSPLLGRPDLITGDAVHPNDLGYQVLAQVVNAALST